MHRECSLNAQVLKVWALAWCFWEEVEPSEEKGPSGRKSQELFLRGIVWLYVNSTQARVIRGEETLIEKMPS